MAIGLRTKAVALWQLTRLEHGIMYGVGVVLGVILSADDACTCVLSHFGTRILLGALVALLVEAGSFALNDYCDFEVDILNRRTDRPLVRGALKRSSALAVSVVALALGVALATLLNAAAFAFAVALAFLGIAYDLKLKETGIAGNIYIAFTMSAPFVFGGLLVGRFSLATILAAALAFFAGFGREVMKGIQDFEGDAARNIRSIARHYGVKSAIKVSVAFYSFAVALSILPLALKNSLLFLNPAYFIPISVADALFLHVCVRLYAIHGRMIENEGQMWRLELESCRKETLLALAFGLLAFLCAFLSTTTR